MTDATSNTFEADFRGHFDRTYGATGQTFADFERAYRFGREQATTPGLTGEDYETAEETLRTAYALEHPGGRSYDEVREAVRYAFERTQALKPHQLRKMDNAHNQFLRGDDEPGNSLESAAAAMRVKRSPNDE